MTKVTVVGGAGYLGSSLCTHLLEMGHEVTAIDAQWFGEQSLEHLRQSPRFHSHCVDVRRIDEVMPLLHGQDAIICISGLVGDPACKIDTAFTYSCNYLASVTLAMMAKRLGIGRFIFASSCSVYGRSALGPDLLSETSATNPLSYYAQDKLDTEHALYELADESFHPTILRLPTLFGWSYRMRFDLVVNLFAAQACRGNKIQVIGGTQRRPFLHVRDAAAAFAQVLETDVDLVSGEVFNVGDEQHNLRIVDLVDVIREVIPEVRAEVVTSAVDPRDYQVDFQKIKSAMGYTCSVSMTDGIAEITKMLRNSAIADIKSPSFVNEARTRELIEGSNSESVSRTSPAEEELAREPVIKSRPMRGSVKRAVNEPRYES
ncbi:MAG: SDR family oxidoreductase [Myxococcota bacterium]